jgi:hypothetical protein
MIRRGTGPAVDIDAPAHQIRCARDAAAARPR